MALCCQLLLIRSRIRKEVKIKIIEKIISAVIIVAALSSIMCNPGEMLAVDEAKNLVKKHHEVLAIEINWISGKRIDWEVHEGKKYFLVHLVYETKGPKVAGVQLGGEKSKLVFFYLDKDACLHGNINDSFMSCSKPPTENEISIMKERNDWPK